MVTNTVKQLRTQKRVSRAHLARQVRLSRSFITRLERGQRQPSAEVMFRLAAYFKCPVEAAFQHVDTGVSR